MLGRRLTKAPTITISEPTRKRSESGYCKFEANGYICGMAEGHKGTKHIMVLIVQ